LREFHHLAERAAPSALRFAGSRGVTKAPSDSAPSEDAQHYVGHRERLRARFVKGGGDALADYELVELVLFRAIPRRDVKPLAKALLARFGSFAGVVSARPERLREIAGLGEAAIVELKIVAEAAKRFAKVKVENRPAMGSFSAVLDYCRTAMAFLDREEFRILFLDKKNLLIADEVQSTGTSITRRSFPVKSSGALLSSMRPPSS
jgi:DNA repair protein RadC